MRFCNQNPVIEAIGVERPDIHRICLKVFSNAIENPLHADRSARLHKLAKLIPFHLTHVSSMAEIGCG
ncbi:hypothetical protein KIN_12660 [Litoreibacter roseus]|uniref:Uncharacterized protein n=1 Tax=Litoreibacter roseus TaxID=2601869 RepID=A0A6N6JG56_9RHOB|nr:hypothetical protein KIN_12660 [Litoreibacter roseus]